jgi:septal ring factor EnvC (AmiA/AmiB activator)
MTGGLRHWGLIGLAVVLTVAPANAASKREVARSLSTVEQKIEQKRDAVEQAAGRQKDTAAELDKRRRDLIEASDALRVKENERARLDDRLETLEAEAASKDQAKQATEVRLDVLMGVLTRFSRVPPLSAFAMGATRDEAFHRALLIRALLPALRDETNTLAASLGRLSALHREMAEERRLVARERQNLIWRQDRLEGLIKARQGLLKKNKAEKAALDRQLAALTDEAKDLRQLLEKLSRVAPSTPTHAGKITLRTPVAGKVVRDFGQRDADGVASQGQAFAAPPRAVVVAPASGRVAFVGPFRGYGQIVILDHGANRYSFLAGFGRLDVELEQKVAAGEPLGLMPDTAKPELYFEWRVKGEAKAPGTTGGK